MNKILFNEKEINFTEANLPMLINGEDKSGASLYTLTLAANLFLQGSKIIILCGYPQAEEEFRSQVDGNLDKEKIIFCTKEQVSDFKQYIAKEDSARVIIIKNVELFDESIFDLISSSNKIILSGDINKCSFKDRVLNKDFNTRALFSPLGKLKLLVLEKYEGFLASSYSEGITKVKLNPGRTVLPG